VPYASQIHWVIVHCCLPRQAALKPGQTTRSNFEDFGLTAGEPDSFLESTTKGSSFPVSVVFSLNMSSSSTCAGASAGGTLTELIALGAADVYLTKNPSITFFRFRYNKHTNFAMEAIEQTFNTQVQYGVDAQVTLNRTGDLIYFQYVVFDLPGITCCQPTVAVCGIGGSQFPCCDPCDPCGDGPAPECVCPGQVVSSVQEDDDDDLLLDDIDVCTGLERPWAHYTNAIGQFLVRRACLVIGGQVIDTLYNDFLFMWEELSGKPGKRLQEMIGKRFTRAQLVADSKRDRRLYVPLYWWFTQTSGNALPMVSLQFHGIQVFVCFETLQRSVQVSDCDCLVVKCSTCQPLTASDLRARLDTVYIYLDIEERDRFATGSFEQLIVQHQQFTTTTKNCQIRMQLNFNHPIIELIWAVRRKCQELCNNHFNYSGKWGLDPIKYVHLRLNNQPRFSGREGAYFRLVQPWQWHTNIPDSFVYCFSFALFPEDAQPSGSANFSRLDNVEFIFDLQDGLSEEDVTVMVFARNWNVFKYREGLGGVAFSN